MNSGWASQWYPCSFTAQINIEEMTEELTFLSAEHWMMFQKALLFSDHDIARSVLAVKTATSSAMTEVKALGRKVQNFDEEIWKQKREQIVLDGNLLKFRQNDELKQKLLETGDKIIVESSPRDRIWGIGFGEKNAMNVTEKWGANLLGKALIATREIIQKEAEAEPKKL